MLALATHEPSTRASRPRALAGPLNKAGVLGAWFSDLAFFLFGYSVWWAGAGRCAPGSAALARGCAPRAAVADPPPRWMFWVGLALLLAASCSLEWTRLYQFEAQLAGGHAGGVLGYALGPCR